MTRLDGETHWYCEIASCGVVDCRAASHYASTRTLAAKQDPNMTRLQDGTPVYHHATEPEQKP